MLPPKNDFSCSNCNNVYIDITLDYANYEGHVMCHHCNTKTIIDDLHKMKTRVNNIKKQISNEEPK